MSREFFIYEDPETKTLQVYNECVEDYHVYKNDFHVVEKSECDKLKAERDLAIKHLGDLYDDLNHYQAQLGEHEVSHNLIRSYEATEKYLDKIDKPTNIQTNSEISYCDHMYDFKGKCLKCDYSIDWDEKS